MSRDQGENVFHRSSSPLGDGTGGNQGKHSLTCIYTALSKPVPGIDQFTAMGLLDDRKIDYSDSMTQKNEKGTSYCQSKQQWFKENTNTLMKQMRQNDTDLHVLQWMHGCEGEVESDGKFKYLGGKSRYGYDGNDFLSFNNTHSVWSALFDEALETKRKWNDDQILKEYTKGYLENECPDQLKKFVGYGKQPAAKPDIYLYARKAKAQKKTYLKCLATGFYPRNITMSIKRNGRTLTRADGVKSSGIRPNNDDTFQRLDHVEILKKDPSRYTCEVNHLASGLHVEREWDHILPESGGPGHFIVGAVGGLMVFVVAVLLFVFRKYISGRIRCKGSGGSVDSGSTDGSNVPLAVISSGLRKGSEASLNSGKSKDSGDSGLGADATPRNSIPEIQSLMEVKVDGPV